MVQQTFFCITDDPYRKFDKDVDVYELREINESSEFYRTIFSEEVQRRRTLGTMTVSSYSPATGCWRPLEGTAQYFGSAGEINRESELKVDVMVRAERVDETIAAIKRIHSYEEPVINAISLWRTSFDCSPENWRG